MAQPLRRDTQDPEIAFYDEGCMAHYIYKSPLRPGGPWKVEVRFYGRAVIDGVKYEWNEVKHIKLTKRDKEQH